MSNLTSLLIPWVGYLPVMVNPPKVIDLDYINFILASQRSFTCTEAARSHPADEGDHGPSHDAFTRLLQRMPQDTEALWSEAKPFVSGHGGVLVLDDTTLDKPYSRKMSLSRITGAASTIGLSKSKGSTWYRFSGRMERS